jgi:hypothetical protein
LDPDNQKRDAVTDAPEQGHCTEGKNSILRGEAHQQEHSKNYQERHSRVAVGQRSAAWRIPARRPHRDTNSDKDHGHLQQSIMRYSTAEDCGLMHRVEHGRD